MNEDVDETDVVLDVDVDAEKVVEDAVEIEVGSALVVRDRGVVVIARPEVTAAGLGADGPRGRRACLIFEVREPRVGDGVTGVAGGATGCSSIVGVRESSTLIIGVSIGWPKSLTRK